MSPKQVSAWGAITTSVISMLTFLGALCAAFFMQDPGLLNLAVGAAIANATSVVQFWIGSSSGSQKKDETIANLQPAAPAPVAIAVANPPAATP